MTRGALLGLSIVLVAMEFAALRSCYMSAHPPEQPPKAPGDNLVALKDGSTIISIAGTPERRVVDWFNDEHATPGIFAFAGPLYEAGSTEPEIGARTRLKSLARMLRARPDVEAAISACGGGADLSRRRAEWIVRDLIDGGLAADRISTIPCRQGANRQSVEIALRRRD